MSSNAQVRRRAVQAARGESPFDLLLIDAQIVDMATGAAVAKTPMKCVPWPVATCPPA